MQEEPLDMLTLVVEVYDHTGSHEGNWEYEVSRNSIINWESIDHISEEDGKSLVRYLLITRLEEYSPITWKLLSNNSCMGEFLSEGVPDYLVNEIPRLGLINRAVEKMYNCLSAVVVNEEIRIVH